MQNCPLEAIYNTYVKIGTIQRRSAWPLRKDDTQIREVFQNFYFLFIYFFVGEGVNSLFVNMIWENHISFYCEIKVIIIIIIIIICDGLNLPNLLQGRLSCG